MNAGPKLKSVASPVAIGFDQGVLIELPALIAAVVSGGAGHGDYIAARALFRASIRVGATRAFVI